MSSEKIRGHQAVQGWYATHATSGSGKLLIWCGTWFIYESMKIRVQHCIIEYAQVAYKLNIHLTVQIERVDYQNRMWSKMGKVGDLLLSNLVNPQVMTLFELVLSNCWIFVNHQNQLPREFTWHVVAGSRHCHSCHREQYGQKSKAISWGFVIKVWFQIQNDAWVRKQSWSLQTFLDLNVCIPSQYLFLYTRAYFDD